MNSRQYEIEVSGIRVHVTRKRIKNIHLSVNPPDGAVRVSSPLSVSQETLRQLLVSRLDWIKKHVRRMESLQRREPKEYISGESHFVQGQRYLLNVVERDAAPEVVLRNRHMNLYVRPGSERNKREEIIREWDREMMEEEITERTVRWER